MATATPQVSAVIPTRNRPRLVGRAVRSALGQTLRSIEVIVVIDGTDDETAQELAEIDDRRLKAVMLPSSVGAGEARNAGVREAAGSWIAFLDDDDEWMPAKLERQIEVGLRSRHQSPVVSCRLVAQTENGESVRPTRIPIPLQPVGEYLFLRTSSEEGDALLQTSTLLTTRELLTKVPWRSCTNDDWDWLLRAGTLEGMGVEFVAEPLAIWHAEGGRDRLSHGGGWRATLEWFRTVRSLVGPRAYASFLLSTLSQWARAAGDWAAFPVLLSEAMRFGRPTPTDCLVHVARWVVPPGLRESLRAALLARGAPSRDR